MRVSRPLVVAPGVAQESSLRGGMFAVVAVNCVCSASGVPTLEDSASRNRSRARYCSPPVEPHRLSIEREFNVSWSSTVG